MYRAIRVNENVISLADIDSERIDGFGWLNGEAIDLNDLKQVLIDAEIE